MRRARGARGARAGWSGEWSTRGNAWRRPALAAAADKVAATIRVMLVVTLLLLEAIRFIGRIELPANQNAYFGFALYRICTSSLCC